MVPALAKKDVKKGDKNDCSPFDALGGLFSDLRKVGSGSYGIVCSATDTRTMSKVAIKRVCPWADDEWDARHTLRELRLMRLLRTHPNIISLRDAIILEPKSGGKNELFLVMELMDSDLHRVISSKQSLSPQHVSCLMAQLLLGAQAMHSIGVLHRDLKPGNVLVSRSCELRITDFGLSRHVGKRRMMMGIDEHDDDENHNLDDDQEQVSKQNPLTEYVVTRWYRCPEVLLAPHLPYSAAVDCWSIGCIFGELIARRPLFQGKNFVHQVQVILQKLGTPEDMGFEPREDAARFLAKQPHHAKPSVLLSKATAEQRVLCDRLLAFHPRHRASVADALADHYFEQCPPELPVSVRPYFEEQRALAKGTASSKKALASFKQSATGDAAFEFGFERAGTSLQVLRDAIKSDVAVLNREMAVEATQRLQETAKPPRVSPRVLSSSTTTSPAVVPESLAFRQVRSEQDQRQPRRPLLENANNNRKPERASSSSSSSSSGTRNIPRRHSHDVNHRVVEAAAQAELLHSASSIKSKRQQPSVLALPALRPPRAAKQATTGRRGALPILRNNNTADVKTPNTGRSGLLSTKKVDNYHNNISAKHQQQQNTLLSRLRSVSAR